MKTAIAKYSVDHKCENCNKEFGYEIPIGHTSKAFLVDKVCPFCGCLVIQKKERNNRNGY